MYKILKDKGNNSNVTLENTDTSAQLNLGKISMEMLSILEKDGFSFGSEDSDIKLKDEWELEIGEDTKKDLERIAMRMKKPDRDQSKAKSEQVAKEKNKKIDAMDVLLGLASYR